MIIVKPELEPVTVFVRTDNRQLTQNVPQSFQKALRLELMFSLLLDWIPLNAREPRLLFNPHLEEDEFIPFPGTLVHSE